MSAGGARAETLLDDFEDVSGWKTSSSSGAVLEIAQDQGPSGLAMRLDFDFRGGGGFVIARKELPVTLPANYAFTFRARGDAPPNTFEFKLVDSSGQNVWRAVRRDYAFPHEWSEISVKKRHIQFAWGPQGGGDPRQVGALEIAIAATTGGKGSIWIDQLRFAEREVADGVGIQPAVRASTTQNGNVPEHVLDRDPGTAWRSGTVAEDQWLLLDFRQVREYGGLIIHWDDQDFARAFTAEVSDDGNEWRRVYATDTSNGGKDYLYLPDSESRLLRLSLKQSSRQQGYGIREIAVQPYEFSASLNHFFSAMARDWPPGIYPRQFLGRQTYWTVAGVDGDRKQALINQDGMVEVDQQSFSIEPFVLLDGTLLTWNDMQSSQRLFEDYIPIPSVVREHPNIRLTTTALATGEPGASTLLLRYEVENKTIEHRLITLYLALRPFQVNPPWQSLNFLGGVSPIRDIRMVDRTVIVNKEKQVVALTKPDRFGAVGFREGAVVGFIRNGKLPEQTDVQDDFGFASGALEFRLAVSPGESAAVHLAVPFHPASPVPEVSAAGQAEEVWARAHEQAAASWRRALNRVAIELPPGNEKIINTVRANLAYILSNAHGPAIHPGPRTYARSWIRDGAFTSAALLRMGHPERVRAYIRWYSQYQFADGRIPCCVDQRGADSVVENDSNGEWLYMLGHYYDYTRDVGLVAELWPQVVSAVRHIDALRRERMTAAYQVDGKRLFYGLLPESISHEGYSSNPVHSYWDGLFALLGLKEATKLAAALGETEREAEFAALTEAFRKDLLASINRAIEVHAIDYVPGSAELGDFDFTSTAIAVDPVGEWRKLPEVAFARTVDEYFRNFERRRNGRDTGANYTPYEVRIVGALVQLGDKQRAHEVLEYLFTGQRPGPWHHWAEIVWHDAQAPQFIGDMPHTWIGAEYISAVRTMFAYERVEDEALVIGAGLKADWVSREHGVTVRRMPTRYGTLNYTMHSDDGGDLRVRLSGDVRPPSGKIVVASPLTTPIRAATVNGRPAEAVTADHVTLDALPAELVIHY